VFRRPLCVIVSNFLAIGVKRLPRYGYFSTFFKMAAVRHLGFCVSMFGQPTESTRLVAFITVQNLIGIDAVVSAI